MPHPPVRTLLALAALAAGLAWLAQAGAADLSDDELKALADQDAKIVTKAADAVEKAANPKDKKVVARNAGSGIKSSAVLMAAYANGKITGKDPAADARAAAVRDAALKIYKAAAGGDFKAAAAEAGGLASLKPAAGKAEKVDLGKAFGELSSKDVMHNFLKGTQYGTDAEATIQANAKKKGMAAKPADAALIAHRVIAMGELNKIAVKAENAADKKEWDGYNEKMLKAAEDLHAAAKKKAGPADLAKAFSALDGTCTACHDKFK